jgi:hypothetical protein
VCVMQEAVKILRDWLFAPKNWCVSCVQTRSVLRLFGAEPCVCVCVCARAYMYARACLMPGGCRDHPYPSQEDKDELLERTGITPRQLTNW